RSATADRAADLSAEAGQSQPAKAEAAQATGDKTRATPAARNVAQQNEVDITQVRGSGEAGRVMKRDVEQIAQQSASQPTSPRPAEAAPAAKPATPVREDRRTAEGDRTEERV